MDLIKLLVEILKQLQEAESITVTVRKRKNRPSV
jgi:hypothetical protein